MGIPLRDARRARAADGASESPCARHGCSLCCHDTQMPLTPGDVARLEALGHERGAFSRLVDGVPTLRTDPARVDAQGAPCVFLHEGRCVVYEHRPEGCRLYPFVLDVGDRVARDEDCPHRDEFAREPDVKRRLVRAVAAIEEAASVEAADEEA